MAPSRPSTSHSISSPAGLPLRFQSRSPSSPPSPPRHSDDADNTILSTILPPPPPASLPRTIWSATVPLLITHVSAPAHPPLVMAAPRLGYFALLLPRVAAFFGPDLPCSSFHHEGILLRNLAIGLLADLYAPAELPWKLTVGDGPCWDIADTFLNCVKEADFLRNGNANQIMKMSKEHTTTLWDSVRDIDYAAFARVYSVLLDTPTPIKHIPLRVYIASSPPSRAQQQQHDEPGSFRVVQSLVPARVSAAMSMFSVRGGAGTVPNRLGQALRQLLPGLFPSSRDPVLAQAVLHGAPVPFSAPLEDLMKEAAYPDGWLCVVVVL